jgi:hypothetical protein
MSIGLQFFNLIIPIENIPDFDELLVRSNKGIGTGIWYDEYLYREGAMGYGDIEHMLEYWQRRGLSGKTVNRNSESWSDLCVVASTSGFEGRCDWLSYTPSRDCVSHVNERYKKIVVPNMLHLVRPGFAGSVIEGRFLSSESVCRGMVCLNDAGYCVNYDSVGSFRFGVREDYVKRVNNGRKLQTLHVYDFAADRRHEYEFELRLGQTNALELHASDDAVRVEYRSIESSVDHSMDEFIERVRRAEENLPRGPQN